MTCGGCLHSRLLMAAARVELELRPLADFRWLEHEAGQVASTVCADGSRDDLHSLLRLRLLLLSEPGDAIHRHPVAGFRRGCWLPLLLRAHLRMMRRRSGGARGPRQEGMAGRVWR